MRRTIHKRAKNKKQEGGNSFVRILIWVFCSAIFLWLTWILWGSAGTAGPAGSYIYQALTQVLGTAAYIVPLFLIYWLYRSVKYKTLAFFTLLFGMALALSGLSILIAFLKTSFTHSSLAGGLVGDFLFKHLTGVAGKSGAIIIAIACAFLGIHVLFIIPWKETLIKCWGLIKEDYSTWNQAKAELKQKISERKEEEKQKESSVVKEEPTEETEPIKKAPPKIIRATAEMIKTPQRIKTETPKKQEALLRNNISG